MNRAEAFVRQALSRGELGHAFLIEAERDENGLRTAGSLARLIDCEEQSGCGKCPSCRAFDNGSHPDIITLRHLKENYSVAEVRSQLTEDIGIRPYRYPYKIYLVPEAHRLNTESQNALLKTLEEPPAYGIIFLISSNRNALLPTVLSRLICLNADENDAEDKSEPAPEALVLLLSALRRAEFMKAGEMNALMGRLSEQGMTAEQALSAWELYLRDLYLAKGGLKEGFRYPAEAAVLRSAADRLSDDALSSLWEDLKEAKGRLKANVNPAMILEVLCLRFRKCLETSKEKQ